MEAVNGGSYQDMNRSVARLVAWTLAWVATLAVATFGPSWIWDSRPVAGWIAIGVNVLVGVGWIVGHARFLYEVDELQRKIMLDAMAVALGTGLVAGCAYASASSSGLVGTDANIGHISALMGLVYLAAMAVQTLRYR